MLRMPGCGTGRAVVSVIEVRLVVKNARTLVKGSGLGKGFPPRGRNLLECQGDDLSLVGRFR